MTIASISVCCCIAFLIVLQTVIIPHWKLKKANTLIEAGDYDAAYVLLEEIERSDVIEENKYNRSLALIESGDYDAAYVLLGEIERSDVIEENKYNRSIAFIESGDYISAHTLLDGLNYQDSEEKLQQIKLEYYKALLQISKVGDMVFLGTYEQDNNFANGTETIEWQVLDRKDDRILVISKCALDCKPYHKAWEDITWENCFLRKWLNEDFLNAAFTVEEQMLIPTVTVLAERSERFPTIDAGRNTEDRVFLLSIQEVNKYFSPDDTMICKPTLYTLASSENQFGEGISWWLRTPGYKGNRSAIVRHGRAVFAYGEVVDQYDIAVRPAMWIDLA